MGSQQTSSPSGSGPSPGASVIPPANPVRLAVLDALGPELSPDHEANLRPYLLAGGDVFVDVGANTGLWACQASTVYKRVIAIEPMAAACEVLRSNVSGRRNVEVIECALDRFPGHVRMRRGNLFFHSRVLSHSPVTDTRPFAEEMDVPAMTLNDILKHESGDITVKVDTEGSEWNIIQGGLTEIRRLRPKILIEVHREPYRDLLLDLAKDLHYNLNEISRIDLSIPRIGYVWFTPSEG